MKIRQNKLIGQRGAVEILPRLTKTLSFGAVYLTVLVRILSLAM